MLFSQTFLYYRDGPTLRRASEICPEIDFDSVQSIQKIRDDVTQSLGNCLKNRFADAYDGVISACKVADLKMWPASQKDNPGKEHCTHTMK